MTPTKDQQAQEYGVTRLQERVSKRVVSQREYLNRALFYFDDMEQAYLDGYTAAEQSMWRSVEEELPEEGQAIIIRVVHKDVKSGKIFESYFDTFYFEQYGFEIEERQQRGKISKVIHWMPKPDLPIPSLPDTNTEKI